MYCVASSIINKEFKLDFIVLERFANAFSVNTSMKKTHLHLVSRLRWDSFVKYLEWFQVNNYIENKVSQDDAGQYHLTENGREMFRRLLQFLECI